MRKSLLQIVSLIEGIHYVSFRFDFLAHWTTDLRIAILGVLTGVTPSVFVRNVHYSQLNISAQLNFVNAVKLRYNSQLNRSIWNSN